MTLACRLFGHRRRSYVYGHHIGRNGQRREKWGTRCTRCDLSGPECWEQTPIERLGMAWWRIRNAPSGWWRTARQWWARDCAVCGQPERQRGRRVGDHAVCDEVPF